MRALTFTPTLFLFGLLFVMLNCTNPQPEAVQSHKQSGAAQALDQWSFFRAYPERIIPTTPLTVAFQQLKQETQLRGNVDDNWEALGPKNIGGRTFAWLSIPTIPTSYMPALKGCTKARVTTHCGNRSVKT